MVGIKKIGTKDDLYYMKIHEIQGYNSPKLEQTKNEVGTSGEGLERFKGYKRRDKNSEFNQQNEE